MVGDRSVPTDIVLPHIVYQDVSGALAWLTTALGAAEHYRASAARRSASSGTEYLVDEHRRACYRSASPGWAAAWRGSR